MKNGSQFNKIPKNNAKPYNENRFLEGFERVLDVLGSSGSGSLLTAPFRTAKVLKNTAKGIYNGIAIPQKIEARKKLALQNQQNAEQLAFKKKQDALRLKEAMKNEKLRQKEFEKNERFKQKLQNKPRNPNLGFNSPNTLQKQQPLNVGAKIGQYKAKQNSAISKGLSNPVNKPNVEDKIKNIMGVN